MVKEGEYGAGTCDDSQNNGVDVKGNRVDVKGNRVDVKGNMVDVKGNRVDVKGNSERSFRARRSTQSSDSFL